MLLATAASLSLGAWSEFKVAGMNLFALLDNFTAIVMLPLLGIFTAIFVGWIWKKEDMRAELTAEGGVDKATYPVIRFLLRWVCPVLVSVVFIFGIMDFAKSLAKPEAKPEPEIVELKVVGVEESVPASAEPLEHVVINVVETDKN
jgi:hypothetical protein